LRRNCLLKHVIEGKIEGRKEGWGGRREDEEEDASNHLMILRKQEDTENCKRKHKIALCG
jgi:hypothetical protein